MNNFQRSAIVALVLLSTTALQAQTRNSSDDGNYVEIGYSPVELSGAGGNAKPDAARFLIGHQVSKNFALEAAYTTTFSKDSRTGYDASYSGFGIYIKPKMALTDSTELFARAGIVRADITASTGGSHTGTDMAYGLGIQTDFTKTVYGQLDYMHSYDRDSVAAKGYTVSIGTRY